MRIIFGILVALIALVLVVVGYLALVGSWQQRRRCRASAPGTVAKVHITQQSRGRNKQPVNIYTPEFRFNADGVTYTYRGNFGSMRREFQEGQSVTVYYDPAEPTFCYVAEDAGNATQGGIMCAIIGLLLGVGAVALFV